MKKYFIIKGHHNVQKFIEINGKAHIVTDTDVLKIRDNLHSNTFLIQNIPVLKIYDIEPINYKELYNSLNPQSIVDIKRVEDYMNSSKLNSINDKPKESQTLEDSKIKNILGSINDSTLTRSQCNEFKKTYFLCELNGYLIRIKDEDAIKTIQYLQTLESLEDFNLSCMCIKEWALSHFLESFESNKIYLSHMLGFYLFQKCKLLNEINLFLIEWKQKDLLEPDYRGFVEFLDLTFMDRKDIIEIRKRILNE